jgi:hypothetical protein
VAYGEISDPGRYHPDRCPQCGAKQPLTGHGFYCRTLVDLAFDGVIRVCRYLCRICKRTVSLLPEFALPWLRFGVADEWVTQLLRQGDSQVFKKYSQMELTMKREALEKMNRLANEMTVGEAQPVPKAGSFGTVWP